MQKREEYNSSLARHGPGFERLKELYRSVACVGGCVAFFAILSLDLQVSPKRMAWAVVAEGLLFSSTIGGVLAAVAACMVLYDCEDILEVGRPMCWVASVPIVILCASAVEFVIGVSLCFIIKGPGWAGAALAVHCAGVLLGTAGLFVWMLRRQIRIVFLAKAKEA
jgi:hypothetical protein